MSFTATPLQPMPSNPEAIRQIIREEITIALSDRLLTTTEACELLGVTRQTLDKHIKSGVIECCMIDKSMRFRRSELLEAGRVKYGRG